jgi:hypothetical protein
MLPDLANMLDRVRVSSSEPLFAQGIAFHHASDAVFHDSAPFVRFEAEARRTLHRAGVPRGACLAIAHVGVELVLDAELARQEQYVAHYLAALNCVSMVDLDCIAWSGRAAVKVHATGAAGELAELCRVLVERSRHLAATDPPKVAERLQRILARRPRLRLSDEHMPAVHDWLAATWPVLRAELPHWWHELTWKTLERDRLQRAQ